MLAAMFITMDPIAGCSGGTSEKSRIKIGRINRASCWTSPAFSASRIMPSQRVMAPDKGNATSMTADLAALSTPWLTALNWPVMPATRTPVSKRPSQIRFSICRSYSECFSKSSRRRSVPLCFFRANRAKRDASPTYADTPTRRYADTPTRPCTFAGILRCLSLAMKLSGKKALVTGSNQGIGQAIALRLAEEGADVVIDYVTHPETAAETVQGVLKLGRRAVAIKGDLSKVADTQRMVHESVQALGGLDILVNNAGVEKRAPCWEVTEADFDLVLDINLKGAFFATQAFVQHRMEVKQPGKVINLSSVHEDL